MNIMWIINIILLIIGFIILGRGFGVLTVYCSMLLSFLTWLFEKVIPLSKPILATIALFYAVGRWNAYADALYYIKQRTDLRPLQLKLYYLIVAASESFQTEGVTTVAMTNPEVLKAACIIFAAVPIICVYPFVQKYFVQGTMVGAVKG